jgi:hypothetical protein
MFFKLMSLTGGQLGTLCKHFGQDRAAGGKLWLAANGVLDATCKIFTIWCDNLIAKANGLAHIHGGCMHTQCRRERQREREREIERERERER